MTRGTTPTYRISFKEAIDFEEVDTFQVTIQQNRHQLTKTDGVIEDDKLLIYLTQEETLGFMDGTAELQVRGKFKGDIAFASNIVEVPVKRVLNQEVI